MAAFCACAYYSVWATEPDADLPIKMGKAGTAAGRPATTVFKVFQKAVENHGDKPALKFKELSEVLRMYVFCGATSQACCHFCISFGPRQLQVNSPCDLLD